LIFQITHLPNYPITQFFKTVPANRTPRGRAGSNTGHLRKDARRRCSGTVCNTFRTCIVFPANRIPSK